MEDGKSLTRWMCYCGWLETNKDCKIVQLPQNTMGEVCVNTLYEHEIFSVKHEVRNIM